MGRPIMLYPGTGPGNHNKESPNAQWNHVLVFKKNNVVPYLCDDCKLEVSENELLVHHRDDDHGNDLSENLGAMHRSCHTSHHNRGKIASLQARHNMSIAHIGNRVKNVKLSESEVVEMRAMYATGKYIQKELGALFGVSQGTAGCAIRGDLYSWVK